MISGSFRNILDIGVIYKEYSKGPRTVPCGTPNKIGLLGDTDFSFMLYVQLVMQYFSIFNASLLMFSSFSRYKSGVVNVIKCGR